MSSSGSSSNSSSCGDVVVGCYTQTEAANFCCILGDLIESLAV